MGWMAALTLIAAFAGGALSTVVADWVRERWRAKRQRSRAIFLAATELDSWTKSFDDLCRNIEPCDQGGWRQRPGDGPTAEASIEMPSLRMLFELALEDGSDRDLQGKSLKLLRAISVYNAKYTLGAERQAQDHGSGVNIRKEAGQYALKEVLPRMQALQAHIRDRYPRELAGEEG